jgi:hypothetical protein
LGTLTLFVRQGCHLCDQFLLELSLDLGPRAAGLAVVDVDSEEALALRYGLRVPVLEADGRPVCEAAYDRDKVRAALRL